MANKIALTLSGRSANDAIRAGMADCAEALESIGISVVPIALDSADLQYAAEQLSAGKVQFALTHLGVGQDLCVVPGEKRPGISIWEALRMLVPRKYQRSKTTASTPVNIWEAFRVPLVKLHADLPAYYVDFHRDVPRNAVSLYWAAELVHFRRRWLPEAHALMGQFPPRPITPVLARGEIDLAVRRSGKLVFVKNGNSPGELRRLWLERLPRSIARLVVDMADEIVAVGTRSGILHIGDFVAARLGEKDIDPDSARQLVSFFSAQLDDYLRRIKSTMIAEAILDLPVLVQGSLWQHVDFTGRRAQLVDGQDFDTSKRIYSEQLGVMDMSPNVDTVPHDRVMRAAGSFSTVLTNRQGWLEDKFPGFEELTFEFKPESIKARVADAISRPDRYLELGVAFGERFRELYTREAFAHRIVEMAELANLQWGAEKPFIQDFFVWPKE